MIWHWEHCPNCNGTGETKRLTGCGVSYGTTGQVTTFYESHTSEVCECCQRRGQIRVPNGYHLQPNTKSSTIQTNTANFTPSDMHIKAGLV